MFPPSAMWTHLNIGVFDINHVAFNCHPILAHSNKHIDVSEKNMLLPLPGQLMPHVQGMAGKQRTHQKSVPLCPGPLSHGLYTLHRCLITQCIKCCPFWSWLQLKDKLKQKLMLPPELFIWQSVKQKVIFFLKLSRGTNSLDILPWWI